MEHIMRHRRRASWWGRAGVIGLLTAVVGSVAPPTALAVPARVPTAPETPAMPQMIDLGTLGGVNSGANALNNAGQVVGWSEREINGVTVTRAFIWTEASGMHGLGTLGDSSSSSFAHDINEVGQVVGESELTAGGVRRAFIWETTSGMRDLGPVPGATSSLATGINDAGQIAGAVDLDGSGRPRPFLWDPIGGMRLIPVPDTMFGGRAEDVNNAGTVVGWLSADEGHRGFAWDAESGFRYLPDPGYGDSYWYASAINDRGWIVGEARNFSANTSAVVLWSPTGEVVTIDAPPAPPRAEPWSAWGNDINESNRVVGSIYIEDDALTHAFVWDGGERLRDLNAFDGTESYATAVNDAGHLVGAANVSPRAARHAVLWVLAPDVTPPVVRCTARTPSFHLRASAATVTASVVDTGSGPVSATVSTPADTTQVGGHRVTLVGTDNAGNTASVECDYSVVYRTLTPFFRKPVNSGDVLNLAVAGKAVPLRFRVLDATWRPVTGLTAIDVVSSTSSPPAGARRDRVEWYTSKPPGLIELGHGYYQFNWPTSRAFAGSIRQLRVDLGDGIIHRAWFKFRT